MLDLYTFITDIIIYCMQEEGIDIEGIDSDGMDEDEEALLQAMDAEDAAAELDSAEMIMEGETVKVEGKMVSK